MGEAAAKLAAFCEMFPELDSEVMTVLVQGNPEAVSAPPAEVSVNQQVPTPLKPQRKEVYVAWYVNSSL
jgi:hypothetical protein